VGALLADSNFVLHIFLHELMMSLNFAAVVAADFVVEMQSMDDLKTWLQQGLPPRADHRINQRR